MATLPSNWQSKTLYQQGMKQSIITSALALVLLIGVPVAMEWGKEEPPNIVYSSRSEKVKSFINSKEKILLYFYADWCAPCIHMEPDLIDLAIENNDMLIVKIDKDRASNIYDEYGVEGVPTFYSYLNGKKHSEAEGHLSYSQIRDLIPLTSVKPLAESPTLEAKAQEKAGSSAVGP